MGTVFATAGWLVTYTVENVVSVPTVEYDIDLSQHTSGRIEVTVHNLSRTHKFSDLEFLLRLPVERSGKFQTENKTDIEAIEPAYPSREAISTEDKSVTFPIKVLQPGTKLKLIAHYTNDAVDPPTFHVGEKSETTSLVEKGGLTWIIRNDINILSVLFLVWTFVVLVVLGKFVSGRERP